MIAAADSVLNDTRATEDEEIRFVQWLAEQISARPEQLALIVSRTALDHRALPPAALTHVVAPGGQFSSTSLFVEASFDCVFLHRMLSNMRGGDWLVEARRVLRPGGLLFVSASQEDFSFAPLPAGGHVHLLRRTLHTAGFDHVAWVDRGNHHFVTSACRAFEASRSR